MATIEFSLNAHIAGFVAGMRAAKESMRDFIAESGKKSAFEKINTDIKNVSGVFSKLQGQTAKGDLFGAMATMSAIPGSIIPALSGAVIAISAVGAAALATGAAVSGMWSAMSRSKEMTSMAEASGMTVTQFMGLEQAFNKAGLALDEGPPLLSHFTEALMSLGDPMSKATYAFAQLGIGANDFNGKTNAQSLAIFADALDRTTDKTKKLLAANAAFSERRGGRMIQALQGGALAESQQNISPIAKIFQESGNSFIRFQLGIERLQGAFLTFFAGMADGLIVGLGPLVDKISRIDFSNWGKAAAERISSVVEMFVHALDPLPQIFSGIYNIVKSIDSVFTSIQTKIQSFDKSGSVPDWLIPPSVRFLSKKKPTGSEGSLEGPEPDIGKLNVKFSPMEVIHPIVDSLTKIGGGGGATNSVDIQRDQLNVLREIANSVKDSGKNDTDSKAMFPTIYGNGGSVGTW